MPLFGQLAHSFCDDVYVNDQVAGFVAEARRYCTLIENEGGGGPSAFEKECLTVLLRLYQQILLLPSADPSEPELPERISHDEWQTVQARTVQRTEHDQYWEVYEPFADKKPDPIRGSISDDLADIWRDIKMGLSIFDSRGPNCMKDAVRHWRFSFGSQCAAERASRCHVEELGIGRRRLCFPSSQRQAA